MTAMLQGAGSVTSVAGGPYSCSRPLNQDDRVTAVCQREAFGAVFNASVTLRAVPSTSPSGHWRFSGWAGCDSVAGADCTVTSGPFSTDEKFPKAVFDDFVAPTVSVSPQIAPAVERAVSFGVSGNEGVFLPQCSVDGCAPGSCGQRVLAEGSHTVTADATDASGNRGFSPTENFRILDTAITGGPAHGSVTNVTQPQFTFSSAAGLGFRCSLDGQAYTACDSGSRDYSGLLEGTHTFRVYSVDGIWSDRIPAVRTWTVDTAPPDTAWESVTTAVNSRNASFAFTGLNGHSGFQCKLDGPSQAHDWAECTSAKVYGDLVDGSYSFAVRAVDVAGNADPSPVSTSWTIAATPPPPPPPPVSPPAPAPAAPRAVRKCTVPKVVGKTLAAAKAAITKAGCRPGKVTSAFSAKGKGRVIRQSPAAGRKVARGTKINLVVSRGARR